MSSSPPMMSQLSSQRGSVSHVHRRSLSTSPSFAAEQLGPSTATGSHSSASANDGPFINLSHLITINSPPQPPQPFLSQSSASGAGAGGPGAVRIYVPPSNDYGATYPGKGTAWRKFLQQGGENGNHGPWAGPSAGGRRAGQKRLFWIALGGIIILAALVTLRRSGETVREASEFADWGSEGGAVVSYAGLEEMVITSAPTTAEGGARRVKGRPARIEDEGLSWKE